MILLMVTREARGSSGWQPKGCGSKKGDLIRIIRLPHPRGGGVLPMWWVIHMCRGFDPLFSLWQDRARSFWGIFSHPPTPKRSFGVLKLPILTEFDLLGPKFHFSLDLFGSNFQRPAAHPHHFSENPPPPPPPPPRVHTMHLCHISIMAS